MDDLELKHYGMPKRSGRYPWGFGDNPFHHTGKNKGVSKKTSFSSQLEGLSNDEKKARVLATRSAKALYEYADLFDYNELNNAYNRLVLESRVKELSPKEINKAEKFIAKMDQTSKVMNSAANMVGNGTKLWNNVVKIYNITESGRSNPLPIVDDKSAQKAIEEAKKALDKVK